MVYNPFGVLVFILLNNQYIILIRALDRRLLRKEQ